MSFFQITFFLLKTKQNCKISHVLSNRIKCVSYTNQNCLYNLFFTLEAGSHSSYYPNREHQPVGRPWYVLKPRLRFVWPVWTVWTSLHQWSGIDCETFLDRGNTNEVCWLNQRIKFRLGIIFNFLTSWSFCCLNRG